MADYTIASGDTMSGIAKKFGVSMKDLLAANSLTDPNVVKVGQKIKLYGLNYPDMTFELDIVGSLPDGSPYLAMKLVDCPRCGVSAYWRSAWRWSNAWPVKHCSKCDLDLSKFHPFDSRAKRGT